MTCFPAPILCRETANRKCRKTHWNLTRPDTLKIQAKPLQDCSACYPVGTIRHPTTAKFHHPRRKRRRNKDVFNNYKISIMQNEDDLRGLAKVMDFMRAISILFVVINIYWFCYQSFRQWGINIGVVDKILLNFQRTAGLFSNILYTKLFSVVFLALSCLGTKGVKEEKITWNKIYVFLTIGFILFFLNWWLLVLPLALAANTALYIFTMTAGYLSLLAAGVMDFPPVEKQPNG